MSSGSADVKWNSDARAAESLCGPAPGFSITEWFARGTREERGRAPGGLRPLRFSADRAWVVAMSLGNFVRIEREAGDGSRHYVIHTRDPKFSMELAPDGAAPDQVGRGVIKRVCLPNSWAGDYGQYAKLMTAAQEFFHESFAEPVSKREARRFSV